MFKSNQTKLLGTVGLLSVLAGALYYAAEASIYKSGKFIILALVPLLINLYTVHCVIYGNCSMYSWLLTIVFTMYAAGIFYMYGRLLLSKMQAAIAAKRQSEESASFKVVAEQAMGITGF
jgi:membrane protein required for beta-lactamase induction